MKARQRGAAGTQRTVAILLWLLLLSLPWHRSGTGWAVELAGGDSWKAEFQNPIWVPVKFSGTFNCIGTYGVNLGGRQARGTNYNTICGEGWDQTYEAEVNLTVYKTYTVLAWSSNLYGCEVNLKAPTLNDLLDGKGKNAHQYNRYRIYVKNPLTEQFERLMGPLSWNTESDGDGNCRFRNLTWQIQVRPAKGARPVTRARERKPTAEDQADESWSKDEDPISGAAAPGDGSRLRLGAGKADDPAGTRIQWEVLLGRLWNGDSAGKVRYLQTRLAPTVTRPWPWSTPPAPTTATNWRWSP
jgi:hypothetical protein